MTLVKPEWGIKRLCQSCGARYYDFQRTPIVCPSCGSTFDSEAVLKSRRARPLPADDAKPKVRKAVDAEEAEDVEEEDDDEDEDEEELDAAVALDEPDLEDTEEDDDTAEPGKRLPVVAVDDDDDDVVAAPAVDDDDDEIAPLVDDEDEQDPDQKTP